jgi:hypothetical protein
MSDNVWISTKEQPVRPKADDGPGSVCNGTFGREPASLEEELRERALRGGGAVRVVTGD